MGIRVPSVLTRNQRPNPPVDVRQATATGRYHGGITGPMELPVRRTGRSGPRVKNIDWQKVVEIVDSLPEGETAFVGEVDQTTRTHIRRGRYAYIDPDKYEVWTEGISRTRANLFMRRKT
jgi:hypothetical protein